MTRRRSDAPAPERRDRLIREREHDTYKVRSKLPDPTACPDCGAMFRAGRWTWGRPPVDAHRALCPTCQRIRDDYPGGYLSLVGDFVAEHRAEILALLRRVEEREKREHPLKRIMQVEDGDPGGVEVTTTDPALARGLGEAVRAAHKGELDYRYSDEGNVLRVRWEGQR